GALPGDDEVPRLVQRHTRKALWVGGVGIDLELAALDRSRRIVTLPENAKAAAVLAIAVPDDDEVPRLVHCHTGSFLVAGGVGIALELAALHHSRRIVTLPKNASLAAVLGIAFPDNDEVARRVHGHAGATLDVGGVGIDLELAALGHTRRVVTLPE